MTSYFDHQLRQPGQDPSQNYIQANDYHQNEEDDDEDEGWASDEFDVYENTDGYNPDDFVENHGSGSVHDGNSLQADDDDENIYDMPQEDSAVTQQPRFQPAQPYKSRIQNQPPTQNQQNHPSPVHQQQPPQSRPKMQDPNRGVTEWQQKHQQHRKHQEQQHQNSFSNTRSLFEQRQQPMQSQFNQKNKPLLSNKPSLSTSDNNNNNNDLCRKPSGGRPQMRIQHKQENEDSGYNDDTYILPEEKNNQWSPGKQMPHVTHDTNTVNSSHPVEIISSKPRGIPGQEFMEKMNRFKQENKLKQNPPTFPPSQPSRNQRSFAGAGRPPAPLPMEATDKKNFELAGQPSQIPARRRPLPPPTQEPVQEDFKVAAQSPQILTGRPVAPRPSQKHETATQQNRLPTGRPPAPLPPSELDQENYEVAGQPPPRLPVGRPPAPLPLQEPEQENYEVAGQKLSLQLGRPSARLSPQEPVQEKYQLVGQQPRLPAGRPPVPLPIEEPLQENYEVTSQPAQLKSLSLDTKIRMMKDRPLPNPQETLQDEYEPVTHPQAPNPSHTHQLQKRPVPLMSHNSSANTQHNNISTDYNTIETIQSPISSGQPGPQLPSRSDNPKRMPVPEELDRALKKGNPPLMKRTSIGTPPQQVSPAGSMKRNSRPTSSVSATIVPIERIPKTQPRRSTDTPPKTVRVPPKPQPFANVVPFPVRPSSLKENKPSNPLAHFNWFKPEMDRKACEQFLNQSKRNGEFIVRNSSKPGVLSISIFHDKTGVRNLQLIKKENGKIHLGSSIQGFDSIPELIHFHQNNSIILNTGAEVTLIRT